MMLLAILVIVLSVILFSLFFLYLFRVHKRLRVRHQKPLAASNSISQGLEQHHELAFVLAHGVEAYNEQRRRRQQQERAQARAAAGSNEDAASSHSVHSSNTSITALPPYSPDPRNGDVGYRAPALIGNFGAPVVSGNDPSATSMTSHPLDNSLPPMYMYQPPSARSTVQAALLTTDNSPSMSIPIQSTSRTDRQGSRRRSVVSGILGRGARSNPERSLSVTSTLSTSFSSSSTNPLSACAADGASTSTSATPPLFSPTEVECAHGLDSLTSTQASSAATDTGMDPPVQVAVASQEP